jgi:hypothetical protein
MILDGDQARAVALYAIAARDFVDFLDRIKESETTIRCLELLEQMCLLTGTPETNANPNAIMVGSIRRVLASKRNQMDKQERR